MAEISFTTQTISTENAELSQEGHPRRAAVVMAFTVLFLTLFGLAMLYSTSSVLVDEKLFIKQMAWAVLGIFSVTVIYIFGYRKVIQYSHYFLGVCIIMLILARLSHPINGAYRWIRLGPISVQPSEFAKIGLIMFLANYCAVKQRFLNTWTQGLIPMGLVIGLTAGLVFVGEDFGATTLICSTAGLMLFIAGVRIKYLLMPIPFVMPLIYLYLKHDPERWSRIISFINPEICSQDSGYQLWNSLLALGSGSWTGLGFTQSRMKGLYLPESHTDFILSITGEELGFITMCCIVAAYLIFMISSIYISITSKDRHGMLLGFGICTFITLQSIINIGVVSGALPTKGIPAPFISYGGSNLFVCLSAVGLLLSIASQNKNELMPDTEKPAMMNQMSSVVSSVKRQVKTG